MASPFATVAVSCLLSPSISKQSIKQIDLAPSLFDHFIRTYPTLQTQASTASSQDLWLFDNLSTFLILRNLTKHGLDVIPFCVVYVRLARPFNPYLLKLRMSAATTHTAPITIEFPHGVSSIGAKWSVQRYQSRVNWYNCSVTAIQSLAMVSLSKLRRRFVLNVTLETVHSNRDNAHKHIHKVKATAT